MWEELQISDLQATLSLRVFLIHDPLLLGSLLLLAARLGCLLTLSVSLLEEVLLHTGTVSVSFLFALIYSEEKMDSWLHFKLSLQRPKW